MTEVLERVGRPRMRVVARCGLVGRTEAQAALWGLAWALGTILGCAIAAAIIAALGV